MMLDNAGVVQSTRKDWSFGQVARPGRRLRHRDPQLAGGRRVHARRRLTVPDPRHEHEHDRDQLEELYSRGINGIWVVEPVE